MATIDLMTEQTNLDPASATAVNGACHENGQKGSASATGSSPAETQFNGTISELGKVFKLLADETRLRIVMELTRRDELHVRAFCDLLGQSQPAVSHHLAQLLSEGLIERRREGKHNYYKLVPGRFSSFFGLVVDGVSPHESRIRIGSHLFSLSSLA